MKFDLFNYLQHLKLKAPSMNYTTKILAFLFFFGGIQLFKAQISDSLELKEFTDIKEALSNPDKVFKLNLSNQQLKQEDYSKLANFKNLQELNLSNDHLSEIPKSIFELRNIRVLNLSGNDFKVIPKQIANLKNLEELFLESEPNLNIDRSLVQLKQLPNLKKLHLENNSLKSAPKHLNDLPQLQEIFLQKNPINLKLKDVNHLKNLKLLHISNKNNFTPQNLKEIENFGIKLDFLN